MERQATKGENICKSFIWQGVNIKKNIKNTYSSIAKKKKKKNPNPNNPIKKWAEDLNSFPKETYKWPKSTGKDAQHH